MKIQISITALLIDIAKADEIIDDNEMETIQNILIDFFKISIDESITIINNAKEHLNDSTDRYQFCKIINSEFNYQQKVQFILSIFKIAFADNTLHYLEEHLIKQIANLLHVEHHDLIDAKLEIKQLLS